jgi:16S rRNA (cytosine1402-N4)-methyltransferase
MDANPTPHIPVLLSQVIAHLQPSQGAFFIDGTFGAGGYSRAMLDAGAVNVLAFDRDVNAVRAAAAVCDQYPNRLCVINAPFGRMEEFARIEATPDGQPLVEGPLADGIVLDLGVSSMQLDQPQRGFSFQSDGPLDMRMSQEGSHAGRSAADLVNTLDQDALADILYTYGDEKKSRWIANAIVKRRVERRFERTLDLASVIARVLGPRKADGKHQATRAFQALRIAVNDELGELARALIAAERLLKPGGRLVVVTFHSLEDRLVKRFMQERAGRHAGGSRHLPEVLGRAPPSFQIINQRAISPEEEETERNPRARSSKLRAVLRTTAAAWPADVAMELPHVEF